MVFNRKEYDKQYRLKNKERLDAVHMEWRLKNKERIKEYQLKNKERIEAVHIKWRLKNKERMKEYNRVYNNKRRRTDINFRLRLNLRGRLWKAVKGISKSASTMELIGCTIDELKRHIELQFKSWMTWENYGLWDIDHVKACATFNLTCPIQQRKCFNWSNLQPMEHFENLRKGTR